MTDRINKLAAELRKATAGLRVDVDIVRSPVQDILDVRAYYLDADVYDFECTWSIEDGSRWTTPAVMPALKDGAYGDLEGQDIPVPAEATAFFDAVGKRIGGYGRLSPSELSLLAALSDAEFDVNEISDATVKSSVEVLYRELTFRTVERFVETTQDSRRHAEFVAAANSVR